MANENAKGNHTVSRGDIAGRPVEAGARSNAAFYFFNRLNE